MHIETIRKCKIKIPKRFPGQADYFFRYYSSEAKYWILFFLMASNIKKNYSRKFFFHL